MAKYRLSPYPLPGAIFFLFPFFFSFKYVAWFCARSEHQMEKVTTHLIAFDMSGWAMWHARYTSYIKKLVSIVQGQCVKDPGHTRSFDRTALG